jgi:hypothetical protein
VEAERGNGATVGFDVVAGAGDRNDYLAQYEVSYEVEEGDDEREWRRQFDV